MLPRDAVECQWSNSRNSASCFSSKFLVKESITRKIVPFSWHLKHVKLYYFLLQCTFFLGDSDMLSMRTIEFML